MFFLWEHLKSTKKPIVLYGMGNGGDIILNQMEKLNISCSGVFASDDFVRGQDFRGFKVTNYKTLKDKYGDMIVLSAFGSSRESVINNMIKIGRECEFYSPDVPVYGENIFDRNFYNENLEKIEKVKNMLSDELSKEIFSSIINFKAGGKLSDLFAAETDKSENFKLLNPGNSENYLDLGAFTGDTVLEFIKSVKKYKSITAVEPDIKNYNRLLKNTNGTYDFKAVNCGIWSHDTELNFLFEGGRNNSVVKKGKIVQVRSIDSILKGSPVSLVKMDIEGSEKEAILGAKHTILKFKPKMKIACYHRTEDIFEIPLEVMKIRNDYKLFIRHSRYIPAWDTDFYFI